MKNVELEELATTCAVGYNLAMELQEEVDLPKDLVQTDYLDLMARHDRGDPDDHSSS